MFSLERELERFRTAGVLDDETAARLIALEQREVVSLFGEVRFLMWAGVMLIATGVGIVISKNLDRIGPLAIALAISAASLGCYVWCEWRRRSHRSSLLDDSILLLAALLASSAIAFVEHQWHLLGANWQRHFLVVAILHGATAYHFSSRTLLSLSISSLAAFFGIERNIETFFSETIDMAMRAFVCAGVIFAWRGADALVWRRRGRSGQPLFSGVFDHFGANLGFWGALILCGDESTCVLGFIVAMLGAVVSFRHGLAQKEQLFVIYAWVYGVIALDLMLSNLVSNSALSHLLTIVSISAAIVGLFVIHIRMRSQRVPA